MPKKCFAKEAPELADSERVCMYADDTAGVDGCANTFEEVQRCCEPVGECTANYRQCKSLQHQWHFEMMSLCSD